MAKHHRSAGAGDSKIGHEAALTAVIGTDYWRENIPKALRTPLANALRATENGNLAEALTHFAACAEIDPLSKPVLRYAAEAVTFGYTWMRNKSPDHPMLPGWKDVAENLLRDRFQLEPSDAGASHALGLFLQNEGNDEEAIEPYEHTLSIDSTRPGSWANLGLAYYQTGLVEKAWECWEESLRRRATTGADSYAQAQIYLRKGDYARGWPKYAERWKSRKFDREYGRQDLSGIHWHGDPLPKNHALFLHGEGGAGDHVQFARYVPLLQRQGYNVVGLDTVGLLKRWMDAAVSVPTFARGVDALPSFTHHCSTLDLPSIFGTTLETIPAPVAPAMESVIGAARSGDGRRIGIAWQGAKGNLVDAHRSIPAEELKHLADIPGVTWVSLQFGPDAASIGRAMLGESFVDGTEGCADALDAAAVMRGLDLIVTVDTLTAHLGGTLGVPTLVLHRFCREWRWLEESVAGESCPWYPSVTSLTQSSPRDWTELLQRVRARLETR